MIAQRTVAWDPASRMGWAYFEGRQLYAAGVMTKKRFADTRGRSLPYAVLLSAPVSGSPTQTCLIEKPRHNFRKKVKVADLIEASLLAGEVRRVYRDLGWDIREFYPDEWKGGRPKVVQNRRTLRDLTLAEKLLIPACKPSKTNPLGYDNNMLDAIGIGMFYLDRG